MPSEDWKMTSGGNVFYRVLSLSLHVWYVCLPVLQQISCNLTSASLAKDAYVEGRRTTARNDCGMG